MRSVECRSRRTICPDSSPRPFSARRSLPPPPTSRCQPATGRSPSRWAAGPTATPRIPASPRGIGRLHSCQQNQVQEQLNGLLTFEAVGGISIVAAPGGATGWSTGPMAQTAGLAINEAVITHCENMLYRVLPSTPLQGSCLGMPWSTATTVPPTMPRCTTRGSPSPAPSTAASSTCLPPRTWRGSGRAATTISASSRRQPTRWCARPWTSRRGFTKAQQELLNPEGVNCLRFFPGPGFLVWGARTISDDPEWKYLSMRRYFCYLEKSIDLGTQWVVFGINHQDLWARVRNAVSGFLLNEWKSGALLGTTRPRPTSSPATPPP